MSIAVLRIVKVVHKRMRQYNVAFDAGATNLLQCLSQRHFTQLAGVKRFARQHVLNTFFSSRSISDETLLAELSSMLDIVFGRLECCSKVMLLVVRSLVRKIIDVDRQGGLQMITVAQKALYVILRSSLALQPESIIDFSPRLYLSPLTVSILEGAREARSAVRWSLELDPLLVAVVQAECSNKKSMWSSDTDSLVGRNAGEYSSLSHDQAVSTKWSMNIDDPLQEQEVWERALRSSELSARERKILSQETKPLLRSLVPLQPQASPFVLLLEQQLQLHPSPGVFQFTALRASPDDASVLYGAISVAMLRAAIGLEDPFGLVLRETSRNGQIILSIHPCLRCPSKEMQFEPQANIRGLVSMLEWCTSLGNRCCALAELVRCSSSDKSLTGSYGNAAVEALRRVLLHIHALAGRWTSRLPGLETITLKYVFDLWTGELQRLFALIHGLSEAYAVHFDDPSWTPKVSLLQVSTAKVLSRWYATLKKHCVAMEIFDIHNEESPQRCDDSLLAILGYLFRCVVKPLEAMMQSWLCRGELVDPFDEFFVIPSYGSTSNGFEVCGIDERRPSFISEQCAQQILNAGVGRIAFANALTQFNGFNHGTVGNPFRVVLHRLSDEADRTPAVDCSCALLNGSLSEWTQYFSYCREPFLCLQWGGIQSEQRAALEMRRSQLLQRTTNVDDTSVMAEDGASPYSPRENMHHDEDHLVAQSPQRAPVIAERWERAEENDDFEEMKRQVAKKLEAEHLERMKFLKHKENLLKWKSRRLGLCVTRNAAIRDTIDFLKGVYANMVSDPLRLTPIKQLVIPLSGTDAAECGGFDAFYDGALCDDVTPEDVARPLVVELVSGEDCAPEPSLPPGELEDVEYVGAKEEVDRADADAEGEVSLIYDSDVGIEDHVLLSTCGPGEQQAVEEQDEFQFFPLDDDEYDEFQAVGVTSDHFTRKREEQLLLVYDKKERELLELADQIQRSIAKRVDHGWNGEVDWLERCLVEANSEDYLTHSRWSDISNELHTEDVLGKDYLSHHQRASAVEYAGLEFALAPDKLRAITRCGEYFEEISNEACRFFVKRTLQVLLWPQRGTLFAILESFRRVCLMQDGVRLSPTLARWEAAAFPTESAWNGPATQQRLMLDLSEDFRKIWVATFQSCCTSLQSEDSVMKLRLVFRSESSGGSPFDCLAHAALVHDNIDSLAVMWMMPSQCVKRYSDLFVCLIFWRWAQRLLACTWSAGRSTGGAPELWLLLSIARGIINAIVEHVWYRISQLCLQMREWQDSLLTREHGRLENFTAYVDKFLSDCFDQTLLAPEFARVRSLIRSLVRQLEEVSFALRTVQKNQQLRELIVKKFHEFTSTASILVNQLAEVQQSSLRFSSSPEFAELLSRLRFAMKGSSDY